MADTVRMYKIFDVTDQVYMLVCEKTFQERLPSMKLGDTVTIMDFPIDKVDLTEFFSEGGFLVSTKDIK